MAKETTDKAQKINDLIVHMGTNDQYCTCSTHFETVSLPFSQQQREMNSFEVRRTSANLLQQIICSLF